MNIPHKLVGQLFEHAIALGVARGFQVSVAMVDASGAGPSGVLRHEEASWQTPEFAEGKARLASAFKTSSGVMFARLQKDRPLLRCHRRRRMRATTGCLLKAAPRSRPRKPARTTAGSHLAASVSAAAFQSHHRSGNCRRVRDLAAQATACILIPSFPFK